MKYADRVAELEAQGLSTSDAQAVADSDIKQGKVHKVCTECGSTEIRADAWANWDFDKQDWVLHSTYDNKYCDSCEGATALKSVPIEEATPCRLP